MGWHYRFVAVSFFVLSLTVFAAKSDGEIRADWASGRVLLDVAGVDYFTRKDDPDALKIAYSLIKNPKGDRVIVLVPGYSESPHKYSELIQNLWEEGYSIAAMSLRGMGLSSRYARPAKMPKDLHLQTVHVKAEGDYVADLAYLVEKVVDVEFAGQARYVFAHSTGGLVAAQYMARAPKAFKSAILNSPLFRLPISTFNNLILDTGSLLFSAVWPPYPLRATWSPDTAKFADNTDGNNELRWSLYNRFLRDNPQMVQSPPSRNWIQEIKAATTDVALKRIARNLKTPTLLLQAGKDEYVDTTAQDFVAGAHKRAGLKNLAIQKFPTAYHSIWRGDDYSTVYDLIVDTFR